MADDIFKPNRQQELRKQIGDNWLANYGDTKMQWKQMREDFSPERISITYKEDKQRYQNNLTRGAAPDSVRATAAEAIASAASGVKVLSNVIINIPSDGINALGNVASTLINLGGAVVGIPIKAGAAALHYIGDFADKGASALQSIGHDNNNSVVIRGIARGAALIPKAIAAPCHIAASSINKAGDAVQSASGIVGSVIKTPFCIASDILRNGPRAIVDAATLGVTNMQYNKSYTTASYKALKEQAANTMANTGGIVSELIKETGTQLVDIANKTDIRGFSNGVRGIGRLVQSAGLFTEGIANRRLSDGANAAITNMSASKESFLNAGRADTVKKIENIKHIKEAYAELDDFKTPKNVSQPSELPPQKMESLKRNQQYPASSQYSQDPQMAQPQKAASTGKLLFSGLGAVAGIALTGALLATGPIGLAIVAVASAYGAKKVYDDVRGPDNGPGTRRSALIASATAALAVISGGAAGYGVARGAYTAAEKISEVVSKPVARQQYQQYSAAPASSPPHAITSPAIENPTIAKQTEKMRDNLQAQRKKAPAANSVPIAHKHTQNVGKER